MGKAESFERLRPLLFSIAYRILGSVTEAEDAVQETWLRYAASPTQPASAKAFLAATVSRISIDVLRSARVRREKSPEGSCSKAPQGAFPFDRHAVARNHPTRRRRH